MLFGAASAGLMVPAHARAGGAVASAYPEEPDGYTPLLWHDGSSLLMGGDWRADSLNGGTVTAGVEDGKDCLIFEYPDGFSTGFAPGNVYPSVALSDLGQLLGMFVSMDVKFSDPFDTYNEQNKLYYVNDTLDDVMYGETVMGMQQKVADAELLPWTVRQGGVSPQVRTSDEAGISNVGIGGWFTLRHLMLANSAAAVADGTDRWWVDGTLYGEHTDVEFSARPTTPHFRRFKIPPVRGGTGGVVSNPGGVSNFLYITNVYVSGTLT